ncbi:MAG TPA: hypothetical protein DDY44_02050 [Candidatus Moranbacteria bacterium]|nr:hypothetical protein [Candidatus Moranbacteria bacterium]
MELNAKKILLVFFLIFGMFSCGSVQAAGLILTETNQGTIDHTVTIESEGQFRLAFEAADNWGLSQWYDLANDPTAQINIASESYSNPPASSDESALFQQVYNPGDPKAHMFAAKYYQPGNPRSFSILENTTARVVVENMYYPLIGTQLYSALQFHTKYVIYPDGKIYITNKLNVINDYLLTEWRNSVIGLGDPSYGLNTSSMSAVADNNNSPRTLTDETKNWTTNQWAGYMASYGYDHWAIIGNTANVLQIGAKIAGGGADVLVDGVWSISSRDDKFGWLRSTDTQNPYTWSGTVAKYLFEYWDPTTPAPNTDWTKASIMLTPKAENPYQGSQGLHDWGGFKRWYYRYYTINLTAGQEVEQQYYMQLGAQNSSILPNIINSTIANPYADDYLNPATLAMTIGTSSGYDTTEGIYNITAANNQAQFSIDGATYKRIKPAFKISNYNSVKIPTVTIDGQTKTFQTDFNATKIDSSTLFVQLQSDLDTSASINLIEGVQDFSDIDLVAPAPPTNLLVQ